MSSFGGPEIPNDNLVLHLDAGNVKSYNYNEVSSSEDFSSADYERSAGLTVLKGFLAPDGSYNASRVTDQLTGSTAVTSTTWLAGYSDTDTAPTSARFSGSLSVVKVYNAALSAEQVLQNFNALRGRYGV